MKISSFTKTLIILLILLTFNNKAFSTLKENDDIFYSFLQIICKNGWWGHVYKPILPDDKDISHNGASLTYFLPDGGGYYSHVMLFELTFKNKSDIPFYNGKQDQVYPDSYQKGTFPLKNYSKFVGVETHFKTHWIAYRNKNKVYVVHAGPTRQDIVSIFKLLMSYIKMKSNDDKDGLEKFKYRLEKSYNEDLQLREGTKIIQNLLIQEGFYKSFADGLFGQGTAKAFQSFLKHKGFYIGTIDGDWGKQSISALSKYQKELEVKITGKINVETANAMEKQILKDYKR